MYLRKPEGLKKLPLKLLDLDEPIYIGYTGSSDGLDKFENTLRETLHFGETLHGIVGPVIGTHAGPGARLIAYVKKQ